MHSHIHVLVLTLGGIQAVLGAPTAAAAAATSGKRGLPYNSAALVNSLFSQYSQITWAYDWSGDRAGTLPRCERYQLLVLKSLC